MPNLKCRHAEPKNHGAWRLCRVRGTEINPGKHCGDKCPSYNPPKGVEPDMSDPKTAMKNIQWDAPACETVEGAPEDTKLWAWCDDQIDAGEFGIQATLAKQVGCSASSIVSAINTRRKRQAKNQAITDPAPKPKPQPEPVASAPDPEEEHVRLQLAPLPTLPSSVRFEAVEVEFTPLADAPVEAIRAFIRRRDMAIECEEYVAGWMDHEAAR